MPTRLQNSKKLLCCTGFAIQKIGIDNVSSPLSSDFYSAGQEFVEAAESIVGESIPIPTPSEETDPTVRALVMAGSVADAMGRLIGGDFALPSQTLIDALTDGAEAIVGA
jgi:hypothetical protein